jgi:hypothetical protein
VPLRIAAQVGSTLPGVPPHGLESVAIAPGGDVQFLVDDA